jgi:hypothetical protein
MPYTANRQFKAKPAHVRLDELVGILVDVPKDLI